MSKLVRFEVKRFPAVRLIGKMVKMSLDPAGSKAGVDLWSSMWLDGSMEFLQNHPERFAKEKDTVGWMGEYDPSNNTYVYIAGVLMKAGTPVPEGFVSRDLPECLMGIGWIQGREEAADLYAGAREHVLHAMQEFGYEYDASAGGYELQYYSFLRFGVPRYIGDKILILDYCCPCRKVLTEKDGTEPEMVKDLGKVMKSFESLAHRLSNAYKCTYPAFLPVEDDRASEISQRQMHGFLQDVINKIFDQPSLIDLREEKDDFYENWMFNNQRPELDVKMKKIEKSFLDFYTYLYKLGECGEVKDNRLYIRKSDMKLAKKKLQQLEQFGLRSESDSTATIFYHEKYPELFPAWKLLCDRKMKTPRGEIVRFIYCMYDPVEYYSEHLFGNCVDDPALIRELDRFFEGKGYQKSFDEYGIHWDKVYPYKQKGNAVFEFNWKRRDQMMFTFRIPNFRLMIKHYDEMKPELQELTFSRMKTCDGCGYCTQMDKTGTRSPFAVELKCNHDRAMKCPYFLT